MTQDNVRYHLSWLSHTLVLLNCRCYHFLILLNVWDNDPSWIFISHRSFLLMSKHYFHVINRLGRIEWSFDKHENVFVIYLLQLPFSWLVWTDILLLKRRSNIFAPFLDILTRRLFWLTNLSFCIGICFSWLSQLFQLLFQISLIQVDRNLIIAFFGIDIRSVGYLNFNISHIGHLNSSTFNSYHPTSQ